MRALIIILSLFALNVFAEPGAIYDGKHKRETVQSEVREFLVKLGWEDYSAQIRESMENKPPKWELWKEGQKFNADRFEIFNWSRELAVEMTSELAMKPENQRLRQKMIEFAARMMAMQPIDNITRLPPEAKAGADEKEREENANQYIIKTVHKTMEQHANLIMADALETLFGQSELKKLKTTVEKAERETEKLGGANQRKLDQIKRIEALISKIIQHMYLDGEMGQSKETGSAFAVCLLRQARLSGDEDLEKDLAKEANRYGVDVRNFEGDTVYLKNRDESPHPMEIRTGDFIMERSVGDGASDLTSAVRPAWRNYLQAFYYRMMGTVLAIPLYVEEVDPEEQNLTHIIRDRMSNLPLMTMGYSHVGTAKKWAADRVSRVRGVDNYPNAGPGGIRIMSIPDQFMLPGPFMRGGRTRYDPQAYRELAREQIRKYDYRPVVHQGKSYPKDGDEEERNKPFEPVEWKIAISEEEFYKLHNLPVEMPQSVQTWLKQMSVPFLPPGFATWTETLVGQQYVLVPVPTRKWLMEQLKQKKVTKKEKNIYKWLVDLRDERLKEPVTAVRDWAEEQAQKMTDHIIRNYLTEGVPFAYGFSDDERLYCTKNVWMANLQATGIDPEKFPDHWHLLLQLAKKLGIKAAAELEPNMQMHAPATFTWQKGLSREPGGKVDIITFPPMARDERARSVTRAAPLPMSEEMTHLMDELRRAVGWDLSTIQEPGDSLVESISAALDGVVRKAQKRVKTRRPAGAIPLTSNYIGICHRELGRLSGIPNKK